MLAPLPAARRTTTVLAALASAALLTAPGAAAAGPSALGGRYAPGVPAITEDFPDPDVL